MTQKSFPNRTLARLFYQQAVCCILFTLFALCLFSPQVHAGQQKSPAKILVINSYHRGYDWSDKIMRGIEKTVQRTTPSPQLYFEYLDTKRTPPEKAFRITERHFKDKYTRTKFSLIIATDHNAFHFALRERKKFFLNIPIVFCGIDAELAAKYEKDPLITGVVEERDPEGTISLAQHLYPEMKRLVAISDTTTTGQNLLASVRTTMKEKHPDLAYKEFVGFTTSQLKRRLAALSEGSVLLFISGFLDSEGQAHSLRETFQLITSSTTLPVFTLVGTYLGYGALGGELLSPELQGEHAAHKALQILSGISPNDLAIDMTSPVEIVLDWNAMERFGIARQDVPEGSIIKNSPESFYARYKSIIWTTLAIGIGQLIIIIALLFTSIKRRVAEKLLRDSEKKFRRIYENMREGYFQAEMDGTLAVANDALLRMTGYTSPSEVVGKLVQDVFYTDVNVRHAILRQVMEKGEMTGQEIPLKKKDGTVFVADCSIHLIYDDNGNAVATEGLIRDISLRRMADELLIESEKMSSLSQLASGMSHALNNPLGAILQSTQNIQRRLSPDLPSNEPVAQKCGTSIERVHHYAKERDILHMLNGIFLSGQHANSVVAQLSSFSRHSKGGRSRYDIHEILADSLTLSKHDYSLHRDFDFKKIHIVTHYDNSIPSVSCIAPEIRQVFLKLLIHSAQSMYATQGAGKPTISITSFRSSPTSIGVSIADNGPGMTKETQSELFTPKAGGRANSLGLAVAKYIIEDHHKGTLVVQSERGEGATYTVTLPTNEEESPDTQEDAASSDTPAE